jgi:hypothetical protein
MEGIIEEGKDLLTDPARALRDGLLALGRIRGKPRLFPSLPEGAGLRL